MPGGRLDRLVCNAAVYLPTDPKPRFTDDGHEMSLQVNHLGHFLLLQLMLPQLQKATGPRVCVVGSVTGSECYRGVKPAGTAPCLALSLCSSRLLPLLCTLLMGACWIPLHGRQKHRRRLAREAQRRRGRFVGTDGRALARQRTPNATKLLITSLLTCVAARERVLTASGLMPCGR